MEPGQKPETNCKITLYSNGFTMNDGPFRKFDDPVNQQFIDSLKNGYLKIPVCRNLIHTIVVFLKNSEENIKKVSMSA